MVKLSNGYLELNDTIEVERKAKLFEDVSTVEGDFSYSFVIPKTQENTEKIKIYSVNNQLRPWAVKIPAEVQNDLGFTIHTGFLRIESENDRDYSASFFSGNSNWLEELDFNLLDLNWSNYDASLTDITSTWANTSGVVFPLTDRGILSTRMSPLFSYDDFQGYIYAKDIVNRCLALSGMKIIGEILKDPIYNKLITSSGNNKLFDKEIENRTVYAAKSGTQLITVGYSTVTFTNVSAPFSNSPNGNWSTSTSRYTFDEDTINYKIEVNLTFDGKSYFGLKILLNGTDTVLEKGYPNTKKIVDTFDSLDYFGNANIGDYIEVQLTIASVAFSNRNLVAGSWIKIYPVQFYTVFASTIIPDMTGSSFLSNIFRMLNMIVSYNAKNKTLTVNKFDSVLNSEPIDISEFVTITENNYEEFISDYARNNLLLWDESSNNFVEDFNDNNLRPYASGLIEIDNDFLEDESNLIEMDFAAAWQQPYGFLGLDLPSTDFISVSVKEERNITSVTNSSGDAIFNFSGSDFTGLGRIINSTVEEYNGDYRVISGGGAFNGRVAYLGNATATLQILSVQLNNADPVLLLNNPNQNLAQVSGVDEIFVNNLSPITDIAIANFLSTTNYIGSLSFEDLKPLYFNTTEKVLNDGVKCLAFGNIPEAIYMQLNFMTMVKVNDTVYYVNRMTGYNGSKFSCTLELIKR